MNNFLKQKKRCIEQITEVQKCETKFSHNMKNLHQTENKKIWVRIKDLFKHIIILLLFFNID